MENTSNSENILYHKKAGLRALTFGMAFTLVQWCLKIPSTVGRQHTRFRNRLRLESERETKEERKAQNLHLQGTKLKL